MALNPIQLKPKQKGGGGLFGSILGKVVGGIGGALIGGPAGAAAGASLGGTAGGLVGSAASPGRVEGGRGVALQNVASRDPQVQLAQLVDASKEALRSTQLSKPEKEQLAGLFEPAIAELRRTM